MCSYADLSGRSSVNLAQLAAVATALRRPKEGDLFHVKHVGCDRRLSSDARGSVASPGQGAGLVPRRPSRAVCYIW